jgi:hypothetical protein
MREIEQDIKEKTIKCEKVNELYFGEEEGASRNKLAKNDELQNALSIESVSDILNKYNISCEDL